MIKIKAIRSILWGCWTVVSEFLFGNSNWVYNADIFVTFFHLLEPLLGTPFWNTLLEHPFGTPFLRRPTGPSFNKLPPAQVFLSVEGKSFQAIFTQQLLTETIGEYTENSHIFLKLKFCWTKIGLLYLTRVSRSFVECLTPPFKPQ